MPTIPYLRFDTFKNYTLGTEGHINLSSPCILIKVMMPMFLQEFTCIWSGEICYDGF